MLLLELFPADTCAGVGFNVQPDGRAALAVRCRGATPETTVVVHHVGLPTVFESAELLTACVPSELHRHPGALEVFLRDRHLGESNHLVFHVHAPGDADPGRASPLIARRAPGEATPTLLIIVLHFGSWPEWLPLFLETCRWNRSVHWLIMTDCDTPETLPDNVCLHQQSLEAMTARIADKLGYVVPIESPYKLCDVRLAFGRIFADFTQPYDFFGWGDLDVVYGNIRRLLSHEALENDVITFYQEHLSGHLTLVRNTPAIRELHLQVPDWEMRVRSRDYQHLDEPHPDLLRARFPVWAKQSYNTPLSPYVPWRDGTFTFPTEWYWQRGRLTNDLDGDLEFLYLHFMHWKGGPWARVCGNAQWERLDRLVHFDPSLAHLGFRVNERGFFSIEQEGTGR